MLDKVTTTEISAPENLSPKEFKSSSLDELPFDEVMQLFAEKKKALRLKDIRKLTQLLEKHPCLFDDGTFSHVEKVFNMAKKVTQTQETKKKAEEAEKKVVSIGKYRNKKIQRKYNF